MPFCLSRTGFDFNPRVQRLSELEVRWQSARRLLLRDGSRSLRILGTVDEIEVPARPAPPSPHPAVVPRASRGCAWRFTSAWFASGSCRGTPCVTFPW